MRLLDQYARRCGLNIRDEVGQRTFLNDLAEQFKLHKDNEILIHGLRVQAMFLYVVAALDHCQIMKEEDSGEIYALSDDLRAPDFRLVTRDRREVLVEVKNIHATDPDVPYPMSRMYRDSLVAYADIFSRDVYLANYWSALKVWTLVPFTRLREDSHGYSLTMMDALRWNEMYLLGDRKIGTLPHLELRLYSDPNKPRKVGHDGFASFTIGQAVLLCGHEVIEDSKEQEIAWMLLNHGDWPATERPAEIKDGELICVSFVAVPPERANPRENFEIVGTLSTMISRQFNEITAPSGKVERLSTTRDPTSLDALIPHDYRGSKLPLWRLVIQQAKER
jgi:hypothetical protein